MKIIDLENLEKPLSMLMQAKFRKLITAYHLNNVISLLEPHYKSFYAVKNEFLQKYAQRNPEKPDVWILKEETKDQFIKEYSEFLNSDIQDETLESNIKKFTIEDFEGMQVKNEKGEYETFDKFDLEFINGIKILLKS